MSCRPTLGLSNFAQLRIRSALGCWARLFPPPFFIDAYRVYLQRPRISFESPPWYDRSTAEPGRGDASSTTWTLAVFFHPGSLPAGRPSRSPAFRSVPALRPSLLFQRSDLAAGGCRVTGDSSYSRCGFVSKPILIKLSTKTDWSLHQKMTS